MQLFYCKNLEAKFPGYHFPNGLSNFGDDLNPWLWQQLIPHCLDQDPNTVFVGIGTLLNQGLPQADRTVVFGTGVGYGKTTPLVDDSWKIYALRGPLSAKALGVAPDFAVTDGAILIRQVFQPQGTKTHPLSFIPHFTHAVYAGAAWRAVCEQAGIHYIDPCAPIEDVLTAIAQTEVLLAEAMHGAIIADALRVPWIPITTSPRILPFKWQDWCLSVGVAYHPHYLSTQQDLYPKVKGLYRPPMHYLNWMKQWGWQTVAISQQPRQAAIAAQLLHIAKTARPSLSTDATVKRLTQIMVDKLAEFEQDATSNQFETSRKSPMPC
jgi:succinoglycan biosynthesis protein ExoV